MRSPNEDTDNNNGKGNGNDNDNNANEVASPDGSRMICGAFTTGHTDSPGIIHSSILSDILSDVHSDMDMNMDRDGANGEKKPVRVSSKRRTNPRSQKSKNRRRPGYDPRSGLPSGLRLELRPEHSHSAQSPNQTQSTPRRPVDLVCSRFPSGASVLPGVGGMDVDVDVDVSCGAMNPFAVGDLPYNSAGISLASPRSVDTFLSDHSRSRRRRRNANANSNANTASPTHTSATASNYHYRHHHQGNASGSGSVSPSHSRSRLRSHSRSRLTISNANLPKTRQGRRRSSTGATASARRVERFNYAKALLRSDHELEKLSRKIRNEIHESELYEVASAAEKAADSGVDNFYGRPSTFGRARAEGAAGGGSATRQRAPPGVGMGVGYKAGSPAPTKARTTATATARTTTTTPTTTPTPTPVPTPTKPDAGRLPLETDHSNIHANVSVSVNANANGNATTNSSDSESDNQNNNNNNNSKSNIVNINNHQNNNTIINNNNKNKNNNKDNGPIGFSEHTLLDHARAAAAAVAVRAPTVQQLQTLAAARTQKEPGRRSMRITSLRDVNEVIPHWNELHDHLRTHFYRKSVHPDTLFFDEPDAPAPATTTTTTTTAAAAAVSPETTLESAGAEGVLSSLRNADAGRRNKTPSDTANHGSSFFGNIAGIRLLPKLRTMAKPRVSRDQTGADPPSEAGTLSPALPPPETEDACTTSKATPTPTSTSTPTATSPLEPDGVESDDACAESLVDEQGRSETPVLGPGGGNKDGGLHANVSPGRSKALCAVCLQQDEDEDIDDDELSWPASPPRGPPGPTEPARRSLPSPTTPKNTAIPDRKESAYSTPAHLRIIKGIHGSSGGDGKGPKSPTPGGIGDSPLPDDRCVATPAACAYSDFEPNSIIVDPSSRHRPEELLGSPSASEIRAKHLAIPAIQVSRSEGDLGRASRTLARRTIRYHWQPHGRGTPLVDSPTTPTNARTDKLLKAGAGSSPCQCREPPSPPGGGGGGVYPVSESSSGDDDDDHHHHHHEDDDDDDSTVSNDRVPLSPKVAAEAAAEAAIAVGDPVVPPYGETMDEKKEADGALPGLRDAREGVALFGASGTRRYPLNLFPVPDETSDNGAEPAKKKLGEPNPAAVVGGERLQTRTQPWELVPRTKYAETEKPPALAAGGFADQEEMPDGARTAEPAGENEAIHGDNGSLDGSSLARVEGTSVCNGLPSADTNFTAAVRTVQGVLSHLSLGSPKSPAGAEGWKSEADNKEFLRNYFYCARAEDGNHAKDAHSKRADAFEAGFDSSDNLGERLACTVPCNGRESPCYMFGMDTICGSLVDLLPNQHDGGGGDAPRAAGGPSARQAPRGASSRAARARDRSSSIAAGQAAPGPAPRTPGGTTTWLGVVRRVASERLHIRFPADAEGGSEAPQPTKPQASFTPPCLSRKAVSAPALIRSQSR